MRRGDGERKLPALGFQRIEPCGQRLVLLARLGGHFLDRLEFLARYEVEPADGFPDPLARGFLRLEAGSDGSRMSGSIRPATA